MTAWVPLIILALLAATMVVMPLIAKQRPPKTREEYDLQVYKDQLRELEDDVARGIITPQQEAAARLEIDRRLLGVAKAGYKSPGKLPKWQAAVALLIAVPAVSIGLYLWRGSPGASDRPYAARPELVQPQAMSRALLAFIAEQETALAQKADDDEGWLLLGRAYLAVGRFEDSANAVRKAIALGRADAGTQTELVEALINAAGGLVTPPAQQAIDAALATDATHPAARYYDGIAKAQAGKVREAFEVWLKLAAETPADAPYLPYIRRQLEDAARTLKVNLAEVMPQPLPPQNPINGMTPEQQQELILQMVDRLANQMQQNPNDLQGWLRLSQSYRVLQRWDEARAAIEKAAALAPEDVDVLTEQAGILLAAADPAQPFPAAAKDVLQKVLAKDPENLEAMYFLGMAEAEAGNKQGAAAYWNKLLTFLDPATQAHAEVKARLETLNGPGRP